jgi:hypothetical protein
MDIQMYNDLIGRKMNLRYRRTVNSYPGIKGYRYTFDVNNFKNSIDYPPNACYSSRLPKEMFDTNVNGSSSNSQTSNERTNSPGSILLDLARRRFGENGNSALANLFNRNILNAGRRQPLVTISNPVTNSPSIIQPTTTTTTTTTTTATTVTPDLETNNNDAEQPTVDEFADSRLENSRLNNPAESLVMTTTETNNNNNNNNLQPTTMHSNAHSNIQAQPSTQPSREYHNSRLDESSIPRDANLFGRLTSSDSGIPRDANLFGRTLSPESRQDQFGSTLGSLFSNPVREPPLLSLFASNREQTNNSPENSSRLNGRLFNRNGNNVLGNLISNGLNRLLSLRNSRRIEDSSNGGSSRTNEHSTTNDLNNNNELNNEPNRSAAVLSRSVRNALHRRVTRNTGPISNNNGLNSIRNIQRNNKTTTHEEYISLRKLNMFPSGAFDFSEIAFGAPILLSQPHFLNADPYYKERVKLKIEY